MSGRLDESKVESKVKFEVESKVESDVESEAESRVWGGSGGPSPTRRAESVPEKIFSETIGREGATVEKEFYLRRCGSFFDKILIRN